MSKTTPRDISPYDAASRPPEERRTLAKNMEAGEIAKRCGGCFWATIPGTDRVGGCHLPDEAMQEECLSWNPGSGVLYKYWMPYR